MKRKENKRMLLLLLCFVSLQINAQQRQYFYNEGFSIECLCKLYANEVYQQQIGSNIKEKAYVCAFEYSANPPNAVIYNVNVVDLSSAYRGKTEEEKQALSKIHLAQLKTKQEYILKYGLNNYKPTTFKGLAALEWTTFVEDTPCKVLAFVKNEKFYLLMITSHSEVNSKYQSYINSFNFLK